MGPTVNHSTSSYGYILRATSILGGSSIISLSLRIVRTKVLAVLLGPAGMGLIGIFDSIMSMASVICGMGVEMSAVRQTAQAAGANDYKNLARTITALRRVSILLGVVGMLCLTVLSGPISRFTFGHAGYAFDVAILSVVLLFGAVSAGQTALLQGLRRLEELAKVSILGAFVGTSLGIPIIWVWGRGGIVTFLVAMAAANLFASWWYAKGIGMSPVKMGWPEVRSEGGILLKSGFVFMVSAAMGYGVAYSVRVLVIRHLGLGSAGLYQAAFALSIVYVGFVLEAMKKDYYPRLTAVAQDNSVCNKVVNEQAEVGSLLSVPVVLATLTFSPVVIKLLYSADFAAGYEVLRWQILGVLLLVANWPMGFVLMAKGEMRLFFWSELLTNTIHLGLMWPGIVYFGLAGIGMAYLGRNVFYTVFIFGVVRRMTGFKWSGANVRIGLLTVPATGIVFLAHLVLAGSGYMLVGGSVSLLFGYYSIRRLSRIVDRGGTGRMLSRIKTGFGVIGS